MFLKHLILNNFKNFEEEEFSFETVNCIVADNGKGKTNILDAIYYLSFCRSFLVQHDSENINYGKDFFSIKGEYMMNSTTKETFLLSMKKGQKKTLKHSNIAYKRFSEHIGKIPCVCIAPQDIDIITLRSEKRRRFIDMILSQTDTVYMDNLISYNKCLEQRSKLLRLMALNGFCDDIQMEIWNQRMNASAMIIQQKRKEFFEEFLKDFHCYYDMISASKEDVDVEYITFSGELIDLFKQNIAKEKVLGYTISGIHRDDLVFLLNGHLASHSASQGQQKTFLLAMKMAQFAYLKRKKNITPILLLDDIFDKFDMHRVEHILELATQEDFGQVFITDTDLERVGKIIPQNSKMDSKIITLG